MGQLVALVEERSAEVPVSSDLRPPFLPEAVRLVDIRDEREFLDSHIPGSCHLSQAELSCPYLRPPKHRRLILLGSSCQAARLAARQLHANGYTAIPLDAPLNQWPGPWESGLEAAPAWEPSPLVAQWCERIPGNRVLDLACGSGRDAVYLAMRGSEVTGIDRLEDALAQAEALAERHHVAIHLKRGNLEEDDALWEGSWDAIVVERFLCRRLFPLIRTRLARGGLLLCETYLTLQAKIGRKPHHPRFLLEPGEILQTAHGLEVLTYREGLDDRGDWIASLVARKGVEHARP